MASLLHDLLGTSKPSPLHPAATMCSEFVALITDVLEVRLAPNRLMQEGAPAAMPLELESAVRTHLYGFLVDLMRFATRFPDVKLGEWCGRGTELNKALHAYGMSIQCMLHWRLMSPRSKCCGSASFCGKYHPAVLHTRQHVLQYPKLGVC